MGLVLEQLTREAGRECNAGAGYQLICDLRDWAGQVGEYGPTRHPNNTQLSLYHEIMDTIMLDDSASKPGSAHAELERRCAPEGSVLTITHTRTGRRATDCAVHLEFGTVKVG